ncbi:MAG TPA: protein kinase [Streptosporangiaceae bacterium]
MHAMAGTGRVIAGRYRLKEPIGRGAMGTVWRGWDEILDREVAIKELRISDGLPEDERAKAYQRTHREARTAARLSHPGLVTVFDVAEEDGRPWIVMELVRARSLDQVIAQDGPLSPPKAAEAGRQLLAALATAHAAGVLHRDVKPSNVLLAPAGRAVLTDFGIATFQGDSRLTQTGMVMGSPGFTAPERIQGNPATPASDLWSLGATLYAAVEGYGPFDRAGGAITTMTAIINSDPPSAPAAAGLGAVIDALLRRNPAERPDAATAARMLGAIGPLPGRTSPEGPGAGAEPGAETAAVLSTSVDLPAREDHTVPVAPAMPRPATDLPPSPAAPPAPDADAVAATPAPRAGSAPTGWITPESLPPNAAPGRRGTGLRTALIALGVVVLIGAVAGGLLALRAHRHHKLASQAASTLGNSRVVTPRTPVAAAAGPASDVLPAGWHWYTLTAAAAGTRSGFELAVPDGWQVSRGQGLQWLFEFPGSGTFLQVDLTPHTYPSMLVEAKYLATLTQKQGHFPGYADPGIRLVNIRNQAGAAWSFTWQDPPVGRRRALDLMYIARTAAGNQSFALYMSAPSATFAGSLATFTEEIRTFRPAK